MISNYTAVRKDRTKGAGAVLTYVREDVLFSAVKEQGRHQRVQFLSKDESIQLTNIYKIPTDGPNEVDQRRI